MNFDTPLSRVWNACTLYRSQTPLVTGLGMGERELPEGLPLPSSSLIKASSEGVKKVELHKSSQTLQEQVEPEWVPQINQAETEPGTS